MKNGNKIVIPIIIGIIAASIIGAILVITIPNNQETKPTMTNDTSSKELQPDPNITAEIQEKLDAIQKTKSESNYTPKPREWLTSGPFQVDRSEYVLGEKIFLRVGGLGEHEIGQVAFLRPLNDTHYSVYSTISFDGSKKSSFNDYFEPSLSKIKGHCTADDFIGDWRVVFRGTDYPNLEFAVTQQILPGSEDDFEPVC